MTESMLASAETAADTLKPLAHTFGNYWHSGILGVAGSEHAIHAGWLIAAVLFSALCGYFLGSINCAVTISKLRYKDDIRKYGSGNAGATNMIRTYGKGAGIATLLGDFLKAVIAVTVTRLLCGEVLAYMSGMFCAFGHAFPCYYRFKGGKCVSVTAATVLMLDPLAFLIVLLIFVIIVAFTKYISLGSIASALMLPLIVYNIHSAGGGRCDARVIFILVTCILLIFLHKENIQRLREGKENKFSFKKGGGSQGKV